MILLKRVLKVQFSLDGLSLLGLRNVGNERRRPGGRLRTVKGGAGRRLLTVHEYFAVHCHARAPGW